MDDNQIRALNKTYLHRDRPTDVMSFSQIEGESQVPTKLLGDVVISVETARRQAREAHSTLHDEMTVLLIHGILHLLGYDHEGSARKRFQMNVKEKELFTSVQSRIKS